MFGEQSIYGQSTVHIDDKKRIILPKYTFAEAGDSLLIVNEGEYFSIHSEKEFEEKLKQKEIELDKTSSKLRSAKKRELLIMYSSILKRVTCDKQGRITLGNITDSNELKCIGAREYLILEPQKSKN